MYRDGEVTGEMGVCGGGEIGVGGGVDRGNGGGVDVGGEGVEGGVGDSGGVVVVVGEVEEVFDEEVVGGGGGGIGVGGCDVGTGGELGAEGVLEKLLCFHFVVVG